MNEMKNFRKSWKAKFNFRIIKKQTRGDSDKEKIYIQIMETSLRIITTTIILLWSIQTYKCTEGFKPGKGEKFFNSFSLFILF